MGHIVNAVCNILIFCLLARSVLSWIVYSGYQRNYYEEPVVSRIYRAIGRITEPIVDPVRRLIARYVNTGPVDFAPLATMFLIIIVRNVLTRIL